MTIICGTDFSLHARRAARVAALIAVKVKEPLRLIHVVDDLAAERDARTSPSDPLRTRLKSDADRLRALGAEVQDEILAGFPDHVLASVALQSNARMLIIAAVGRRDPKSWLLGCLGARLGTRSTHHRSPFWSCATIPHSFPGLQGNDSFA